MRGLGRISTSLLLAYDNNMKVLRVLILSKIIDSLHTIYIHVRTLTQHTLGIPSVTALTYMFNCAPIVDLGSEVSANGTLKYFHHEGKQRSCQGCVPSAFGRLVANESVLRLHFKELEMGVYSINDA